MIDPSHSPLTQPSFQQRVLLIAFIVFAVLAFIVAVAMFTSSTIADTMLPYYGWPVIGLFYLGALKYAIPPLTPRNVVPVHDCLRGITRTMVIVACFGLVSALIGLNGDNYDNPYLTVHVLQPVWSICVPLLWGVVCYFVGSSRRDIDAVMGTDSNVLS